MYERYTAKLKEYGVTLLEKKCVDFETRGLKMEIFGYELPEPYYKKFCRAIFRKEDLVQGPGKAG